MREEDCAKKLALSEGTTNKVDSVMLSQAGNNT